MYAAVATRPDIAFAVSALSQFLSNPGSAHWEAVKRVFRVSCCVSQCGRVVSRLFMLYYCINSNSLHIGLGVAYCTD
jgi:hypothetical protein